MSDHAPSVRVLGARTGAQVCRPRRAEGAFFPVGSGLERLLSAKEANRG